MIGENLSHFVSVRQFVGINSTLMKAMRLVLGKPGISLSKVSILIGGPDWPTSVLAGIMRLKLLQIMIGTMPIVFLIFPTVLTGALLYMTSLETETGNPQFPWAGTVSTISASVTGELTMQLIHLLPHKAHTFVSVSFCAVWQHDSGSLLS